MRVLALIALLAATAAGQPAELWRYVHPEARLLAGVQWRKVMQSGLQKLASGPLGENFRMELGGVEFADEVEFLLLSSPGKAQAASGQGAPFLVAMTGRFDLAKLRNAAALQGAVSRPYKTAELLLAPQSGDDGVDVAVLSARLLLAGDRTSLMAALDGPGTDPARINPLVGNARALAARRDIWLVAASPADFAGQQPMLAEVENIEGGIALRDGLLAEVSLQTGSEESAKKLAGGLGGLLALASLQQEPLPALAKSVQIKPEGAWVRAKLSVEGRAFEQALSSALAQGEQHQLSDWVRPAGTTPEVTLARLEPAVKTVAPPPPKKVIRIVGLEDGPREIPYP